MSDLSRALLRCREHLVSVGLPTSPLATSDATAALFIIRDVVDVQVSARIRRCAIHQRWRL
jgi:hypothetical protein